MRPKRRQAPNKLIFAIPLLLILMFVGLIRWITPSSEEMKHAVRQGDRNSTQFPATDVRLTRDQAGIVATITLENIGAEDVRGCVIDSFSVGGRYPQEPLPLALGAFERGRKEIVQFHIVSSSPENRLSYKLKGSCYSPGGTELAINSENEADVSTSTVTK